MEYKPNKKDLIVALSVAVLGLSVFVIFSSITFVKNNKVSEEIYKSTKLDKSAEVVIRTKKQISDLSEELTMLDSFFVKSGEEAYFLNDLESLAKSHNVKIATDNIMIKKNENATDYKDILSVNIKYEGSYGNVISFLKSVQGMPRAVVLDSIDFNNGDGGLIWSGNASLSVYKLR